MLQKLVVVGLVTLFFMPVILRAQTTDIAVPPVESDGRFPTFGIAVDNLDGWTRVPEESPENIARWAMLDPKTGQPQAVMDIFVGRSGDGLIAYAQNQARNNGGTISGEAKIDGERGILVTTTGAASIIAKHGDLFYILGIRQAGGKHEKDFLALAGSIHWMDIEPPVKHLDLGDAIRALGGAITVQVPACMRPRAGQNTPVVLNMVATDIVNRREIGLLLQPATIGASSTLEQAQKDLLDGWNHKLHPVDPFTWTTDPKHPTSAVTNQVQVDVVNNGQRGKMTLQFGMAWDAKRVVVLSFTANDAADNELETIANAVTGIVQSITFKTQATTQPGTH